jgi:teichuronic acid exporter
MDSLSQTNREDVVITWSATQVARKASKAALALGLRQVLVQSLNLAGGVLLARTLSTSDFGLYAICLFILAFLNTFGDAGLGASLIRQPENPSVLDYQAIFSVQQILVLTVSLVFWLIAPWVVGLYKLPEVDIWIFRCVSAAFFVTSFQTIPAIDLERNLAFDRLAWIEVSQALVFNLTAVLLALYGFKAMSFGIAILLRSVAGATLANLLHRWDLRWKWDFPRVKRHLAYGIPYQASSILNLLKDLINPLLIGVLIGPFAVGYLNWATTVANYPLIFVMLFNRLYLPTLAKVSGDLETFNKILTMVVKILCSFVYAASVILFVFRFEIVQAVFGSKWIPALVLFPPFIAITFILAPTIIGIGALNALGNSKFVFSVTLIWVLVTWFSGLIFIPTYGWESWGWVNLLVNLSNFLILHQVSVSTGFSWLKALKIPSLTAVICVVSALILFGLRISFQISIAILLLEVIGLMFVFLNHDLRSIMDHNKNLKGVDHAA